MVDPATGIRIGLPTKMVPHAHDAARGTRWSSAHGEVQVETFRIKDPALTLAALFEKEKKEPATRKVETSALRDDDFFISGMQGLKIFSVRARARDGEVRGFTMLYDQMMEGIVAPVMVAMASAFSPFPERSAPYAALAKSVEYGTGLVVSPQGHIVTDRKLAEGCQVIVAAGLGDADRVADDKDNGLALLRVYGPQQVVGAGAAARCAKGRRSDAGRHSRSQGTGRQPQTDRDQGAAGGRHRDRIAPAGADGGIFRRRRARRAGPVPRHDGNGQHRACQRRAAAPPVRLVTAETIRDFLAAHHVRRRRHRPPTPRRRWCG